MFTYDPLWKLLIDRKMSKTELREAVGFSTATLAQMSKDQNVSMEVLNKICNYLDVPIEQVIKQVKESK